MADTIKVTLTPAIVAVQPGASVEVAVAIHNTGLTVEEYGIEIEGLPPACYTLPDSRIALFPNDHDEVRLTIRPSQEGGMGAGDHPFTLTVVARADPAQRTGVEGLVQVAAAAALDAQLRPSRVTGRKARYTVQLRNRGNAPLDVDLDAYDSEEGCDFTFKPPMAHLDAGQQVGVSLRVYPLRTRLVGPEHNFDFQIMIQPSLGETRPLRGLFIYRPRFRSWRPLRRFLALAAAVAAIAIVAPLLATRLLAAPRAAGAPPVLSVGNVKLGATNPTAVMADLGRSATLTHQGTVITSPEGQGAITASLRNGQVVSVETTSPQVQVANGVHVGSSVLDLEKTFGSVLTVVGGTRAAAILGQHGVANGPTATATSTSTSAGSPTVGPMAGAMASKLLAGGDLVVTGRNTVDGQHPQTYFDLDKTGTRVTAIRTGIQPWIIPDQGGATRVSAITRTATWTLAGAPYFIGGPVRIPPGVTLTINPGVHVYFTRREAGLYVDGGALHAVGTAAAPVVFTALDDQQHGAFDTLNRPAPHKGDWAGLGVTAAGGTLDLDGAEVYYGAAPALSLHPEIYVDGRANPTVSIQNTTIEAAAGYGLDALTAPADTVIHGDVFNADNYPLLINGGMSLDDSNLFAPKGEVHNTHDAVYVHPNATIAAHGATVLWTQRHVPFILQGDEIVGPGGTLGLGPGVILKGHDRRSGLTVAGGTLIADGQEAGAILLTSYADDAQGGDSNGNGTTTQPHRGDWRGLTITGQGRAVLQRVKLWWAGSAGRPALAIAAQATVEISRTEVAQSGGDGISNGSGQPVAIVQSFIHDNAGYGLNVSSAAAGMTTLAGNRLARNGLGGVGLDDRPAPQPAAGAVPTAAPPTPNAAMGMGMATAIATAATTPTTAPASSTPAPAATSTPGPTATSTSSPTDTPAPVPTATDTPVPSPTATDTPGATATATPTSVPTQTDTPSATQTATPDPTQAATPGAAGAGQP